MKEGIRNTIQNSVSLKECLLRDEAYIEKVKDSILLITRCYEFGGKILLCGNGGSAADAQHLAAEFGGKFYFDRQPLHAEALHCNTSFLTAVANDYSYDLIYQRMVQAAGIKNDVLMAFSTSGNSKNIVNALQAAKKNKMHTIGFTGKSGGKMAAFCDIIIKIPSNDTARIQEAHIMTGHIICEWVERNIFNK